jgi:ribosome-binding factor A
MTSFRKDRVAELIRQVLADLILAKIKDPRIQGVTITEVELSADLKSARVYFSSLNDGAVPSHQAGLEAAEGFIRRELRRELDLRYIPHLSFAYDTSFDHFARIDKLLKDLDDPERKDD